MSKSRAKGNRNQRKAIQELESSGWLVQKVEQGGKFTKVKDCFGLFDLLCIKKEEITYVLFLQITSNAPHVHRNYCEFAEEYAHENLLYEQWAWQDRKGWKKFRYYGKGEYVCYEKPQKKPSKKPKKSKKLSK